MLLANYKPEMSHAALFYEPTKEYKLPELQRSPFEDAFDELELLGFPVSFSPFDLLQTRHRGDVFTEDMIRHKGKIVRMIGYLVSIKHVPTKRGMMNFGTWFDVKGAHFDTVHFSDSLAKYPFKGGGCYLIQGKVQVDFDFPIVRFKVHEQMKGDISTTLRSPYPSPNEIGLPRDKMAL